MMTAPVPPNELSISRARLKQGGDRRDGRRLLESSLSAVTVFDITGPDEVLVVPEMHAISHISPRLPHSHFAAQITGQLRQIRRDALVDPTSGVAAGRAIRFTSYDRYAAWLVMNWLRPPSVQTRAIFVELLTGQSMEQWQRRAILPDGHRLVRLIVTLAAEGLAVEWIKRLAPGDCQMAVNALGRTYGFASELFDEDADEGDDFSLPPKPILACTRVPSRTPFTRANRSPPSMAIMHRLAISAKMRAGSGLTELPRYSQLLLLTTLALGERPNIGALFANDGWVSLALMANDQPVMAQADEDSAPNPRAIETTRAKSLAQQAVPFQRRGSERPSIGRRAEGEGDSTETSNPRPIAASSVKPDGAAARAGQPLATPRPAALHTSERSFDTEFGGLMFIINVLLALKLYPNFTSPLGRRLAPSPFWLLAHLGAALFGKSFRRDPLFRFLRDTGEYGALPKRWQVEPEWLEGSRRRAPPHAMVVGKNRTTWDGQGISLSDPDEKPWSRKMICAPRRLHRRSTRQLHRNRNERWIASLAAYLQVRIAMAAPGLDITMLRMPASVTVTDHGVELYFSLTQLPLAVRLAGLDRNPGWLPSEGSNISFHFS